MLPLSIFIRIGSQFGSLFTNVLRLTERQVIQMVEEGKTQRGFASMSPDKQREIASKGGKTAHQRGTAHEFTPEEARVAGKKGGEKVSQNRAHMAEIGRKGGRVSHS